MRGAARPGARRPRAGARRAGCSPSRPARMRAPSPTCANPSARRCARSTATFTALGDDADLALLAAAQAAFVRARIAGSELAALPLLSAAAPFLAGGRGGPRAYTDIPAGKVANARSRGALSLPETRSARCGMTGAEIVLWLERAAGMFRAGIDTGLARPAAAARPARPLLSLRHDPRPDLHDRPDAAVALSTAMATCSTPMRGACATSPSTAGGFATNDVFLVATNSLPRRGRRALLRRGGSTWPSSRRRWCARRCRRTWRRRARSPLDDRLTWRLAELPDTCEIVLRHRRRRPGARASRVPLGRPRDRGGRVPGVPLPRAARAARGCDAGVAACKRRSAPAWPPLAAAAPVWSEARERRPD